MVSHFWSNDSDLRKKITGIGFAEVLSLDLAER